MINEINNFLSKEEFESIEKNILNNPFFPWFPQTYKVFKNDGENHLTHMFYIEHQPRSRFLEFLQPIINKLKPTALIRIKANLSFKENSIRSFLMHTDQDINLKNIKTGIFYLNTNDGKTIFKNGKEINSEKNKMVIFPNELEHCGTTHTNTSYRFVINFNWF
jgi:hypothetical protein